MRHTKQSNENTQPKSPTGKESDAVAAPEPAKAHDEQKSEIKEAAEEYRRWAKGPHSYQAWFIDCRPSDDGKRLLVIYRPHKIGQVELRLHSTSRFADYAMEFRPEEVAPEAPPQQQPKPKKQHAVNGPARCGACGKPCAWCA